MRALHIVKTGDGARWAAHQVRELVRSGVDVEVALPSLSGRSTDLWMTSGAGLHAVDLNFPVTRPWLVGKVLRRARGLVERLRPDVVHSHFVSTTLTMRAALKGWWEAPRLFQVPGPLHLEHWFFSNAEIASAGPDDYWIASSRCTRNLYLRAGISNRRVFLSYYGLEMPETRRPAGLRSRLGIPADAFVAGNLNMFYRPKRYLGQRRGVKAHEDVIEALRIVIASRPNVYGVLLGGPWDDAGTYFESLRRRAATAAPGRILLPGPIPPKDAVNVWREFDCAVHVPLSENCGGVVEPLLAGVPVVAGRVGGLPEVVIDDVTGRLVPVSDPVKLAEAILAVAASSSRPRMMAACGSQLVAEMFSPTRTGSEIKHIYEHVLGHRTARPAEFDSTAYVQALAESA